MTARQRRNLRNGILFISPWIVGFLAFQLYPIVQTLIWSFTRYQVFSPPVLIGLDNYWQLFRDPLFLKALKNTFIFVGTSVPLGTIAAIAVAMLLNTKVKGMAFYRTIYYLPCVVPGIASTVLWGWILDPQVGLLNGMLEAFHLPAQGWLSDPALVKPSLIIMNLWGIGYMIVIYLAGLGDVPQEMYEVADLDGATFLQRTVYITLPMLSPVILFNVIMGMISGFQIFMQTFVLLRGGGGPLNEGLMYAPYLYQNAFSLFRMGYASSMAWIMLMLISVCTAATLWLSKSLVFYRGAEEH